jgi:DNA-binding NarL/FixJ family response regulator
MMTIEPVRVLIADDHPLFRRGIRTLLRSASSLELVGEAETGDQAVAMAVELQPDVVLMDLQMPDGGGISATRRIVAAAPSVRVLVVTLFQDDDSVFAALRAGAHGYMVKDAGEREMIRAIEAVGHGEAIFSPTIAGRVLAYFGAPRSDPTQRFFPTLTEREREILDLIARGQGNTMIARELNVSPKTIANHVSNIFSKLQVADRAEAIIRARDAGLG